MIKKTLIKRILIGLALLITLPLAIVYGWSTIILNETYDFPLTAIHIPNDTASIRQGERLTRVAHCAHCHGDKFSGGVVAKVDYVAEFIARLIKDGVKKTGNPFT